jgi:hypothetical protein
MIRPKKEGDIREKTLSFMAGHSASLSPHRNSSCSGRRLVAMLGHDMREEMHLPTALE